MQSSPAAWRPSSMQSAEIPTLLSTNILSIQTSSRLAGSRQLLWHGTDHVAIVPPRSTERSRPRPFTETGKNHAKSLVVLHDGRGHGGLPGTWSLDVCGQSSAIYRG